MSRLYGVMIGLVMANFLYQFWFTEVADYAVAAERSYFQVVALAWYYAYCKVTKETE